ncbi:MAG: amylo-alpha-1,6-glucosidase [Bacteroidales bacterium]
MNKYLFNVAFSFSLLTACSNYTEPQPIQALNTENIGIQVLATQNREYSYTDKKSAYYYGRTHQNNFAEWFAGWNIAKKRIFSDYDLFVDNTFLDRENASVTVYPDKLVRVFDVAREEFRMNDQREILVIDLSDIKGDSIGIQLHTSSLGNPHLANQTIVFDSKENPNEQLIIAPLHPQSLSFKNDILKTSAKAGGFLISFGAPDKSNNLISEFRKEGGKWQSERHERLNNLIVKANPIKSNLDSLDRALSWLLITTDQLVTKQQGNGIYAGLPWFNEYWGRDMFISMPGATLVSGQFDVTKEILSDFSNFQDTTQNSPTLGRIPNRANLEGILYNTTDGTPRFVMQILDYVKYSGDTAFIREIYPAVTLSIDAAIANHTDKKGYLLHADADTWMDVKRNGIPGSPRGNRANDIQSLWLQQLEAGVYFAEVMNDKAHALKWEEVSKRLKLNFEKDFTSTQPAFIADHLNADHSQDLQFRPNQLYAFELINDEMLKMEITRKVWEELVYPWGVASLSQTDKQFHPLHENWHYYHKDDAYHNGTVWLWNNGHAMQRMIEFNQQEIAWKLFKNMNRQALLEGAVGSLSENADAHPREGASWAKRSGTFLQAWSNAEQLRVWYQYFLGIRPDLIQKEIVVEPKLPQELTHLNWQELVGNGSVSGSFERTKNDTRYTYTLNGLDATIDFRLPLYSDIRIEMKSGELLLAVEQNQELQISVTDVNGNNRYIQQFRIVPEKKALKEEQDQFFKGTQFCKPVLQENLPATRVYHKTPLTY